MGAIITIAAAISAFWSVANIDTVPSDRANAAASPASSSAGSDVREIDAGLAIPVEGVTTRSLVDTYRASRSGGRVHNAIDIMAPRGTPILAAAAGTVERLHRSRLGGITVYIRTADNDWVHYYAHLDAYAPGLAVGQRIEQGQNIGTVGFTGNASPAGPHLHFAVYRMANGQRWHQGTPVNPYPLLARSARAR